MVLSLKQIGCQGHNTQCLSFSWCDTPNTKSKTKHCKHQLGFDIGDMKREIYIINRESQEKQRAFQKYP